MSTAVPGPGLWSQARTPDALERLGARIAERLKPGEAVCLWGPLGAGKSTLARGLIRALAGSQEDVPSPTFTLVQTYDTAELPIAHFDLYRLKAAGEVFELGLSEALASGAAVIEWPERLEDELPSDRLDIELQFSAAVADGRDVRLTGHGSWLERVSELGCDGDSRT